MRDDLSTTRSIGILTVLNALGAGLAILKSVVMATLFGTSRAVEAFFAASALQVLLTRLTQTGQLAEVFLPVYLKVRHERGREDASRAFSIIVNWIVLATITLGAILWWAAPVLVDLMVPGFDNDDRALSVSMFRWLIPLVACQVYVSLAKTLSNAERWYGRPESVTVLSQLAGLATLIIAAGTYHEWALIWSLWVAQALHVVGIATLLAFIGHKHRFCLRMGGFSATTIFSKGLATLTYVGATQGYQFVLNAALSLLPQGTFAVFNYVIQLNARILTILLRPVAVVFFTDIADGVAKKAAGGRQLAQDALSRSLAIGALVVVVIWTAGRLGLSGLWGSAAFDPDGLDLAVRLLQLLSCLFFVAALGVVARKSALAHGHVKSFYACATAAQLVSAGAVWILPDRYGIEGAIAGVLLAGIVLRAAGFVPLFLFQRDALAGFDLGRCARWAIACAAGFGAGKAILASAHLGEVVGRWQQLLAAAIVGSVALAATLLVAWALRIPEIGVFKRLFPGSGH